MSTLRVSQFSIPQTVSLRERVRQLLLAQIMSGELVPEEVYSVAQLAAGLDVSPTPIREAVLDLASKDLLVIHKNRGFSVPPTTPEELEELHKIRLLLEVPSTVEAGLKMSQQEAEQTRVIAESTVEAAQANDLANYIERDRRFHEAFLLPLAMPHLTELIMNYRNRARLRGLRAKLGSKEIVTASQDHIALVDAALAKDEALLHKIITNHIEATKSRWAEAG